MSKSDLFDLNCMQMLADIKNLKWRWDVGTSKPWFTHKWAMLGPWPIWNAARLHFQGCEERCDSVGLMTQVWHVFRWRRERCAAGDCASCGLKESSLCSGMLRTLEKGKWDWIELHPKIKGCHWTVGSDGSKILGPTELQYCSYLVSMRYSTLFNHQFWDVEDGKHPNFRVEGSLENVSFAIQKSRYFRQHADRTDMNSSTLQ